LRTVDARIFKDLRRSIELVAGYGVTGDAHFGPTAQHLFDRRRDPAKGNLRQVHLLEFELIEELQERGFALHAGSLGENVVTRGVRLDSLPCHTELHLGDHAVIALTGLRQPCVKIDRFQKGLRAAVTTRRSGIGPAVRGAVMGVVRGGGVVRPGDPICIELPATAHPLTLV
jgi:MOSC domain-containing protein YiiM